MSWVRIDDQLPDHPKIALLADGAKWAMIRGLCYANRYLTDGVLPTSFLATVRPRDQAALVQSGVWERDVVGVVRVHDYHDYQLDRDAVLKRREQTKDRVRRYRERLAADVEKQHGNARTGEPNGNAVTGLYVSPDPIPIPIPSQREDVLDLSPSEVVVSPTWEKAKARLRAEVSEHTFQTWFEPIEAWRETADLLELRVPKPGFAGWVQQHYSQVLTNALDGKRWSLVVRPLATRAN